MGKLWRWLGVGAVTAALCVGCGAGKSLRSAQDGFAKARAAGAEAKAPYEFTAAQTYLQLAEHESKEDDFRQTEFYAEKSLKFSQQAAEKAGGGAQ